MTPEQALIRIYRNAATRLRAQVRGDVEAGRVGTAGYHARQLTAVQAELRTLGIRTRTLSLAATLQHYRAGGLAADLGAIRATGSFTFNSANRRAAATLADNLASRLGHAVATVGRRTEDLYRTVALQETGQGVAAGATRREVSAAIERRLVDEKVTNAITGFVDKAGRRWALDTYSEMVARTTTREAVTEGFRARMGETGQELVTISDHGTTTEICLPYEGETYSMEGIDVPGYAEIPEWPPFHPRCQHYATAGAATLDETLSLLEREVGAAG